MSSLSLIKRIKLVLRAGMLLMKTSLDPWCLPFFHFFIFTLDRCFLILIFFLVMSQTYNSFIIALFETWLNSNVPSSLICLPHYVYFPFRQDRLNVCGDGSLILIIDLFSASLLSVLPSTDTNIDININFFVCRLSFLTWLSFIFIFLS